MNKFAEGLGLLLMGLVTISFFSVLNGTLLWLIWEDSITAMFPKSIESGILASKLTWLQAVKITWIFTLLIKNITTSNPDKK